MVTIGSSVARETFLPDRDGRAHLNAALRRVTPQRRTLTRAEPAVAGAHPGIPTPAFPVRRIRRAIRDDLIRFPVRKIS
ncbi:Uncharacterised protein [Amycolatopsis camponoti]|uniref:Uncharacterized protein n=1 Tax=Amycolatopsis camponoti TaxID=2606593 RepID=A0A6I8M2G6_9PSEU|nr:Uncharacterised protein [Amycolatopsis camponoti]